MEDVGHHDGNSVPSGIPPESAPRLSGLPAWFVGVRCPLEVVMERRRATWGTDNAADVSVPASVRLWQVAVYDPGIYDLEVDTSILSPTECGNVIRHRLQNGPPPLAFRRLALAARDGRPQQPASSTSDLWL